MGSQARDQGDGAHREQLGLAAARRRDHEQVRVRAVRGDLLRVGLVGPRSIWIGMLGVVGLPVGGHGGLSSATSCWRSPVTLAIFAAVAASSWEARAMAAETLPARQYAAAASTVTSFRSVTEAD